MKASSNKHFFITLILALFVFSFNATSLELRIPKIDKSREIWIPYAFELLQAGLNTTELKGQIKYNQLSEELAQDRSLDQLRKKEMLDVFWTMTSKSREEGLGVVRIPLLKGLLGHRLILIRGNDQEKFSKIKTLDDLKKITLGQGHDWPDTFILKDAGLNVFTTPMYGELFGMLASKKFDGFPRGINEIWGEQEKFKILNLKTEKNILITYHAPVFFFVNKENKKLLSQIERGLLNIKKSGEFDRIFNKYWASTLRKSNVKGRIHLHLDNQNLSEETRKVLKGHPEYMINIKDY